LGLNSEKIVKSSDMIQIMILGTMSTNDYIISIICRQGGVLTITKLAHPITSSNLFLALVCIFGLLFFHFRTHIKFINVSDGKHFREICNKYAILMCPMPLFFFFRANALALFTNIGCPILPLETLISLHYLTQLEQV